MWRCETYLQGPNIVSCVCHRGRGTACSVCQSMKHLTAGRISSVLWPWQVVEESDVVFLAVKPQYVASVLKEVRPHLTDSHTIVSIAAGKTLASLKARCPTGASSTPSLQCLSVMSQDLVSKGSA